MELRFVLNGSVIQQTCKVIKGLMEPIILGWDWFSKYKAVLDAGKGVIRFNGDKSTPLIPQDPPPAGCFYRAPEDIVLPPNSKVHAKVELMMNNEALHNARSTVITEPFTNNGANFWAARSCSYVKDSRFITEFANTTNHSLKVEAGHVIGFAEFVDEDSFAAMTHQTDMTCYYQNDEGYESGAQT